MEKKKIIIAGGVVLLIVVLVSGYYLFSAKAPQVSEEVTGEEDQQEEVVIPTISPNDLGLTFVARTDKKAVKFTITKIIGIESIDYEISYLANGDIPRGAIGRIEVKPKDQKIETNYIDLGTCSSGRCKYDEGVESVKLLLKIVKRDGNSYSAEQSLDF